jgi:polyhydroxybutyrate depolymerase
MRLALILIVLALTVAVSCRWPSNPKGQVAAASEISTSSGCNHLRADSAPAAGTTQNNTLADQIGSYSFTVPHSYRSGHPMPLILLFYGFASDPSQFSALTRLPVRASADGYVVAVPHAQGDEWQFSGNGTDAAFVSAMVVHLESTYCINTKRVFATGFSAGAAFTIFYACGHQGSIAAIATVAVEFQLGCTRPLSIIAFHGTKDPLVPYQNGAVGLSLPGVKVRGTQRNMSDWARLDHCRSHPRMKRIGSQVDRQWWTGCTGRTSLALYSILGGGHSWPGADPKKSIGLTTQQISATNQILGFFDRSPS